MKIKEIFEKAIDERGDWKLGISSKEVFFLKEKIDEMILILELCSKVNDPGHLAIQVQKFIEKLDL